ncbi:MAG: ATP F0F1 synthase subunit B [Phenylobacterium sp.]
MLTEAHFWVGVALVIFLGVLAWAGVPAMALKALDARGQKVQAQLDEANQLREEARALLAEVKAQREQSETLAAEILANAREDAKRLAVESQAKLEEQVARRGLLAEQRIATAEAQAAAQVKAAAGELAAQMAEAVLVRRLAGATADPLVDSAIGQLASKLQ